jgi:hypothetical protein
MKWFFCWCQDTEFRDDHNWKDLIRVAVASAQAHTSLEPHLIYDGEPSDFTAELAARGVTVLFHRLSFTDNLAVHHEMNHQALAVARGAFLRFDIALFVDPAAPGLVLYTDADVVFQHEPEFSGYQPAILAAAPQSERGTRGDMNSGVMLLNPAGFGAIYDRLIAFTKANLHLGLDQEVLRAFIGEDYLLLPDIYNWKPYWGINEQAPIVHWHGPKPQTVAGLLSGQIADVHAAWRPLYEGDPNAYAFFLNRQRGWLDSYHAGRTAALTVDSVRVTMQYRAPPAPRFAICACARWESRYIAEWLAYYRELGFCHVYLYCNDDEPGEFYQQVLPFLQGPAPFVTFHHNATQGAQTEMYEHFLQHHLAQTDWVSFFDIDEYLRLPAGQTIADFTARYPSTVDCILFNWVFFGPNGHDTPPDGLVLESYTRRAISVHGYTKYVARSRHLRGIKAWDEGRRTPFWHWPLGFTRAPLTVINVLGEACATYEQGFPGPATAWVNEPARRAALLGTAVVHHYALRTRQSYRLRVARGLGGNFEGQTVWSDLADGPNLEAHIAQLSAVEDISLAGFWAAMRARAAMSLMLTPTRPLSFQKLATASSAEKGHGLTYQPDPGGAVDGNIDGRRKFHTRREANPWWQVDLGGCATITGIKVYNTADHTAARCRDIRLSVSIDGESFAVLAEKCDGQVLGDYLTGPFTWAGPGRAWGRYVRVTLLAEDFFHLDQVEIFGTL